jgi:tRNA(Ile)-lysidine synthase
MKDYIFNTTDQEVDVNELDQIIKIYVIEKYLKDIYKNDISLLNNKHIEIIINNLSLNRNVIFDLPNSKIGIIEYNNFKVIEKTIEDSYIYEFTEEVILPNNGRIYIDNNTKDTNNFVIHLNSKEIKLPFIVRTRKDGDFMIVKNMLGTKKINDIFINSKIPKQLRDSYPIVTDSTDKIIWIPGIKKSHLDRKKEQKYDIILKYD